MITISGLPSGYRAGREKKKAVQSGETGKSNLTQSKTSQAQNNQRAQKKATNFLCLGQKLVVKKLLLVVVVVVYSLSDEGS